MKEALEASVGEDGAAFDARWVGGSRPSDADVAELHRRGYLA